MTEADSELTVAILDRGSKYLYERMAIGLAIFSALLLAVVVIWVVPLPLPLTLAMVLPMGAFVFYAVRFSKKSSREAKLVATDKEPGLIFSKDGINGSIVLLEGKKRDELDNRGEARFSLKWSDISQVKFEQGRSNPSSPPYMVITPKDEFEHAEYYFLLRDSFFGKEQRMVDIIRAHGVRVEIEGKIH